ncbi:cupredoxin domain-containing protein [Patescibacteria group bacterium]|nr:cupredoxin domain-containing protein [Patescibacteria group bacterium]
MKLKIILASIIGILVIVGVFFVFNRKKESRTKQSSPVISAEEAESLANYVIKMTPGGFSPSTINIKKGETVAWINEDSQFSWPASDIHPTHLIYSEFDPKEPIASGEGWLFTFEKTGQWNFHDHLRPRWVGTVIVE